MIGRLAERAVLVMLVCTTSILAVDELVITKMTWTLTPGDGGATPDTTTLVVCTETEPLAQTDEIIRLVVQKPGFEYVFNGNLSTDTKCADFSAEENLPMPSAEEAQYKMAVGSATTEEELSSGTVSFAYPVTNAEMIDCGGTSVGRLSLSAPVDGQANCFQGSGLTDSLCYVDIGVDSTVCLAGLDTLGSDVEVCTTITDDPTISTLGTFTAKYIDYSVPSISISHSVVVQGPTLTELLSRVEGGTGPISVHACSDDKCSLSDFVSSVNNYELCGVFSNAAGVAKNVGTTTFQDLQLTIDSPSPTVDFHFYNVAPRTFNVYEDANLDDLASQTVSFILDCTRIPEDKYCNGFIPATPATITVSLENGANAVAITVPSIRSDEEVGSLAAGDEEAGIYRQQ